MGRYVQVSDDLADALQTPAGADWERGRGNLAIHYALTIDHPDRAEFHALVRRVHEPAALQAAQEVLARSGAVGYCAYQMIALARQARHLLAAAPLADPAPLARLLALQHAPVERLLAQAGPGGASA
jgi:geranylgeranyl pyrophosphate synthase